MCACNEMHSGNYDACWLHASFFSFSFSVYSVEPRGVAYDDIVNFLFARISVVPSLLLFKGI